MIEELYRETVVDHYRRPRNRRRLESPTVAHAGENPFCGDRVEIGLKVDGDRIAEIGFHGAGCAISQASASMLTELVQGGTLAEAEALVDRFVRVIETGQEEGDDALGDAAVLTGVRRFPVRARCALLAWMTLREAIGLHRRVAAGAPTVADASGRA
jgi:nitrogen fixation NifU-like protein